MSFKTSNLLLAVALFGIFSLSSCLEDDIVEVIETPEEIEETNPSPFMMTMSVNEEEIVTNAYAASCSNDSVAFTIIANKSENLSLPLEWGSMVEGDYLFMITTYNGVTSYYGGVGIGEEITGNEGFLTIAFSEADIDISTNNETNVIGTSEGTLYGINSSTGSPDFNNPYNYSLSFSAEVLGESEFCDQ